MQDHLGRLVCILICVIAFELGLEQAFFALTADEARDHPLEFPHMIVTGAILFAGISYAWCTTAGTGERFWYPLMQVCVRSCNVVILLGCAAVLLSGTEGAVWQIGGWVIVTAAASFLTGAVMYLAERWVLA